MEGGHWEQAQTADRWGLYFHVDPACIEAAGPGISTSSANFEVYCASPNGCGGCTANDVVYAQDVTSDLPCTCDSSNGDCQIVTEGGVDRCRLTIPTTVAPWTGMRLVRVFTIGDAQIAAAGDGFRLGRFWEDDSTSTPAPAACQFKPGDILSRVPA